MSLCANSAISQEVADSQQELEQDVELISVTGSRIPTGSADTAIPTTSLNAETISLDGGVRISDIVNQLPSIRTTQTAANTNVNSEKEAGTAFIDLRGFGIDRTLVLIDGRRQVGGRPGSSAVDTNTIPTALVQRVEVITGGASAVYGADAVSGVVNFIMRDDFEGIQIDTQGGVSDEGDGEQFNFSLTGGKNFSKDKGNAYFNFTYERANEIVGQDRDYANRRIRFASNPLSTGPNDGIPDLILFENTGFVSTPPSGQVQFRNGSGGTELGRELGGPFTFGANGQLVTQDEGQLVESFLSVGGNNAGDLSRFDLLQTPMERILFTTGLKYDVSDEDTFFAKVKYATTDVRTAEQTTFSLPGLAPIIIDRDNPYVPEELRQILVDRGDQDFFVSRTNIDHGRRRSQSDRETFQMYLGFEGYIWEDYQYSIHYQYGKTDIETNFINRQLPSRFNQALDAVLDGQGNIVCRDQSNGCVPINVLGANAASPEALAFISTDFQTTSELEQQILSASLVGDVGDFGGILADLAGFAVGIEYREEETSSVEGELRNSGDLFNSPPIADAGGDYDVFEAFAELSIPILQDVAFAQDLSLDAAIRFSDYSTIGQTTAWKLGGVWALDEQIKFRFTVSTAVRAPNIGELFAPENVALQFLIDPCDVNNINNNANRASNCAADGIPDGFVSQSLNRNNTIITGGNAELSEEESDSYTVGLVIKPNFIDNFSLAVDLWDIQIKNAINSIPAQDIINSCYDDNTLNNPFCAQVTRQANGQFDIIRSTLINIASFEARGLDIESTYDLDLADVSDNWLAGDLLINATATYLDDLTFYGTDGGVGNKEAGELGDPRFSLNLRATYKLDALTISVEQRYQSDQVFDRSEPDEVRYPNNTGGQWYTDLQARVAISESTSAYVGIDNLFDQGPPDLAQVPEVRSFTGDAITYDQIGRFIRVGFSSRF